MKNNPFKVPEYELSRLSERELTDGIKEIDSALSYIEKIHAENIDLKRENEFLKNRLWTLEGKNKLK